MKIKLKTIIEAVPALKRLNEAELPLATSYKVYKLVEEINGVLAFFSDKRDEIQRKSDNGEQEIVELLEQEENLSSEKIPLDGTGSVSISAADIKLLFPFVDIRFGDN